MPRRSAAIFGALVLTLVSILPASAQPSELRRITERPNGRQAEGSSGPPADKASLSSDGRLIAFASYASNLVGRDENETGDIFLYHPSTDETELLTHDRRGGPTNGDSGITAPDISARGRYVAFDSEASDLVEGDDNHARDIFVLDRKTGKTEAVSVRKSGVLGDRDSYGARISSNGRYVAFGSKARNLSRLPDKNGRQDVFIHDRKTGTTNRVSISSRGREGNDNSYVVGVSNDGDRVGFLSFADNLVPNDTNEHGDAFVYDRSSQRLIRASVSSDEEQSTGGGFATDMSSDGRYVLFNTDAANLVDGDTNENSDVFLRDLETETTERVSVATGGIQANNYSHNQAAISANGCLIAFDSGASNLVEADTNDANDIFVRDRCNDETTRINVREDGTEANRDSYGPEISPEGNMVTFATEATNLRRPDRNHGDDLFLAIR